LPSKREAADVTSIVEGYGKWLARSAVPKLFVAGPTWPNQREVTVKGMHYIQEDSPKEIAEALQTFVRGLALRMPSGGEIDQT